MQDEEMIDENAGQQAESVTMFKEPTEYLEPSQKEAAPDVPNMNNPPTFKQSFVSSEAITASRVSS